MAEAEKWPERKKGRHKPVVPIEEYRRDPCKVLSIPYWKAKRMTVPADMKIVHSDEFVPGLLDMYDDRKYFRIRHDLKNIPEFCAAGIELEGIPADRLGELADVIDRSYTHSGIRVSAEDLRGLTTAPVYCPELWIGAYFEGGLVGSVICDHDAETGEGAVEWLQVLPEYRKRGIASALICKALRIMRGFADFASVSGECDNITSPERVYRRCGFTGNDVWHILRRKTEKEET